MGEQEERKPQLAEGGVEITAATRVPDLPDNQISEQTLPGAVFDGKYRIIDFLGSGGYSRVYKATHVLLKKTVAIKVLHEQYASDEEKRHRLTREARTVSSLSHPNIVAVHDYGFNGPRPYLIMDYVEGSSLDDLLRGGKQFSVEECVQIACQACDALSAAHTHGVIHRDLKPANIMLVEDRDSGAITVKLVDFGLAKIVLDDGDSLMAKTATGEVLGTPIYMSPEQCLGAQLNAASDIYSLGCVLYELLTGVNAFSGESALAVMLSHISAMPKTFSQAAPERRIPLALEAAVFKSLAKKPEERFRSAEDFKKSIIAASERSKNSLKAMLDLLRSRISARRGDPRALVIILLASCLGSVAITSVWLRPPHWRVQAEEAEVEWLSGRGRQDAVEKMRSALLEADRANAPCLERARLWRRLADFATDDEQEVALQCYEKAASVLEGQTNKDTLALLANNLNYLSYYQKKLLKFQPSLLSAQKAVAIASQLPNQDKSIRRDSILMLGQAYYNLKEFDKAEVLFKQALTLESSICEQKHRVTSTILFVEWLLCKTYLAREKLPEANAAFNTLLNDSRHVSDVENVISDWKKKYNELEKMPPPRFDVM